MIITFGGNVGAGKSTMAPLLAKELGYEEIYVGGIFRQMAKEQGLTIEEFYALMSKNPKLEKSIDAQQLELMQRKHNIVVQGRIAYFFAKQTKKPSINIFLAVDPRVGAERKIKEGLYPGKTLEEVMALNSTREANERSNYLTLYGITDHLNPAAFDIVCDTTGISPEKVLEVLLKEVKEK